MTTVTKINLREEIVAVTRRTELTSPQEIAGEVMKLITPENAVDAVSQMLSGYVRVVLATQRSSAAPKVPTEAIRSAGSTSRAPAQPSTSGRHPVPPPSHSRPSPKVTQIREGWQRFLLTRVHVDGGWKLFKDLTENDLRFAAQERRDKADQNLAEARRYEAWAQLVAEHEVATFSDLPAEVQMKALGSVA